MNLSKREEIIRTLLDRYNELVDPMQQRAGAGDGVALPLMPQTYTGSVRETERLVAEMRLLALAHGRVIYWRDDVQTTGYIGDSDPDGNGMRDALAWRSDGVIVRSTSIGLVRRHVVEWFLRAEPTTKDEIVLTKQGARLVDANGEPMRRRSIQVNRPATADGGLALLGVSWIADHWALQTEPMIPSELLVT